MAEPVPDPQTSTHLRRAREGRGSEKGAHVAQDVANIVTTNEHQAIDFLKAEGAASTFVRNAATQSFDCYWISD